MSRDALRSDALAGRVALVTGANGALGSVIARELARRGAPVCLAWHGAPRPDASVEWITDRGGLAVAVEADLSEPGAASRLLDRAEETLGGVSILVNNAAAWRGDTFVPVTLRERDRLGRELAPLDAATFDLHFAVNARAPALLMAELARRHLARGARYGRIVNVSTGGAGGFPEEVSYGASKAALESLTRAAAVELGPFGITVNAIRPGPLRTGWLSGDAERELAARTPARRLAEPTDVAELVAFLASDRAALVTGQVLSVDGGLGVAG